MVSQYSQPSEFNKVIQPVNIDLLQQSLATKQAQIDKGYSVVQDELDKYIQYDIYRPEDREYLQNAINATVKTLNSMNGIDLSDVKSIYKIKGIAGQLANDETIVNARLSTARIRKEDAVMDAVATNPKLMDKYNIANAAYYMEQKQKYLNGELSSFNEKFMLDTTKSRLQDFLKSIPPTQWQEIQDRGFTVVNNTKKTLEDLKRDAMSYINSDPNASKQLEINYWYDKKYGGLNITPNDLLEKEANKIQAAKEIYSNAITDIVTNSTKFSDDQKEQVESQKKMYESQLEVIKKSGERINNLREKIKKGVDLTKDSEYEQYTKEHYYDDYLTSLAAPFVIPLKQERKANVGYIKGMEMEMKNQQFTDKMKYETEKLGLQASVWNSEIEYNKARTNKLNREAQGLSGISQEAYPSFPTEMSNENLQEFADTAVINRLQDANNELANSLGGLAQKMIANSNLNPTLRNRIAEFTYDQLKNFSKDPSKTNIAISPQELKIVSEALGNIEKIIKSDKPEIPSEYTKYMGDIRKIKDQQIVTNYLAKYNPLEDAKTALTPKEYEEYTKLTEKGTPTKYQSNIIGGSSSGLGISSMSGLAKVLNTEQQKRKEQLEQKVKAKAQERQEKFATRTQVNNLDIPEEGEKDDPKALNHPNNLHRASILRMIREKGVNKGYNDKAAYAVEGNINSDETRRQKIFTTSDQINEFKDVDLNKTKILKVDSNGKILVQLYSKDGKEKKGTPVYVDGSNDTPHLSFLNKFGLPYQPVGGITVDDIIREQRGAYNNGKVQDYTLAMLDPESKLNIPYNILSDKTSIFFEFTLPDGSRVKTPLRDSSGLPISSKQDVENVILQTIQINKNRAKGDQQKFYQYMVESLKAMDK